MLAEQESKRRVVAATTLAVHVPKSRASEVVNSLTSGLTQLRELMTKRVHEDVERNFVLDSTMSPVSQRAEKLEVHNAKLEMEIYAIVVVADEVQRGSYVDQTEAWMRDWLFQLRLGEEYETLFQERVEYYRSPTAEERRLKFLRALQKAIPESARAPLVLFRMFPRAIRIVAAVAFGDLARAMELRSEQCSFLPAVDDCLQCRGRVLENDEDCRVCGNPVWEFEWLQAD